jgi:hypothetical protein
VCDVNLRGRDAADRANDERLLTCSYLSKESIALVLEDQGDESEKRGGCAGAMREVPAKSRYPITRDLTPLDHPALRPLTPRLRSSVVSRDAPLCQ